MKYVITNLLMIVLVHGLASAQWVQTSGPSGGFVTQLAVNASNGYVFAIAGGDVYRSTDNGATWEPKTNSLQANMGANVIAASGTNVYMGLGSGTTPNILSRSTDNGDTWTAATAAGIPGFYIPAAMIVSGSKLIMYASYLLGGGKTFASTDAGDNWVESQTGLPTDYVVQSFVMKGSDIYAGSSSFSATKGIYKSTDNGANWTPTGFTSTYSVASMTANSVGVFACTGTTGVYRSTDNGSTWPKINPDSPTNFSTALLATSTNLFIGVGGYMYKADQNGNTWDSIRTGLPPANAGTAIYYLASSGSSVMCGYSKHGIYRTTNSGANWFQSHSGLKALKIDGIHSSNGYVFAAGDQYGYFRSPDHGDTWVEINNGVAATAGWFCFARVGSDLLAGAGSSLLYRSSDNGDNWALSNSGFALVNSFAFYAEGNTVYTTGLAGVSKSTDGGLTWNTLPAGYLGYEAGLDIWKDGTNILTGTNVANHRSTDDGASWGTTSGAISAFTQIDTILFSASAFGVKKSTDHGATWTSTAGLPFGVGAQCLAAIGTDLFVGTSDGVYRSTDMGGMWNAINQGFASKTSIYKITYDNQYLYAGTVNRSVWRRSLSEITSVEEMGTGIPSRFSLGQNYPNPFNPRTEINFQIMDGGFVTLKVYDILGKAIASLVNDVLPPGAYRVSWDASSVPSGVYYYRISTKTFTETKSMILAK